MHKCPFYDQPFYLLPLAKIVYPRLGWPLKDFAKGRLKYVINLQYLFSSIRICNISLAQFEFTTTWPVPGVAVVKQWNTYISIAHCYTDEIPICRVELPKPCSVFLQIGNIWFNIKWRPNYVLNVFHLLKNTCYLL